MRIGGVNVMHIKPFIYAIQHASLPKTILVGIYSSSNSYCPLCQTTGFVKTNSIDERLWGCYVLEAEDNDRNRGLGIPRLDHK
jgi:hypothetical protein